MSLEESFPRVTEWHGRHVVICNWRDGRHPDAGGAELYCEQVARELHESGVRVTYLTARPRGTARRERVAYGTVVRGGGRFTVYPFVLLWLLFHRTEVDGVIDSQNGIPFFTPLALRHRTPIVLLIHHVHQDQFGVCFPAPAAALGRWLEGRGSRLVYRERAIAAVSPSSRAEIRARLSLRGPVHLAPCGRQSSGADSPAGERARASEPRVVCVGRLVPQKRVDRLVRAVPGLRREFPEVRLDIVGDGEERQDLEKLAVDLGVADAVVFHGRVTHEERDRLVGSAWITATASMGEGWGLSVMEAAALGVPAVAYAVPGLRDTIIPGTTGWLAGPGEDLSEALGAGLRAVRTPRQAEEWAVRCLRWAARFGWDATAGHLLASLTAERDRLLYRSPHHRSVTDASALVTAPAALFARADLGSLRATDLLDTSGSEAALLLVGADEQDAQAALARIGVAATARDEHGAAAAGGGGGVVIRLARHSDALGWRQHPPPGTAASPTSLADISSDVASENSPARNWLRGPAALLGLFALALVLRLCFIHRSYDLFIDEITYATVGYNLATGHGVTLYGHLFALHPPAFFALLAAVIKTVHPQGGVLRLVLDLRPVDAVAGSVTVVAVTALLRRAVRPPVALAAGLLLACDPFLNRFDSLLMLEAPATAAAALGTLVLARTPASARGRAGAGVAAGLLFALSITTKELYALVTVVPLAVLAFAGRGPVRRLRLTAVAATVAGYGGYVAVTAATGDWSAWWAQKSAGIARAVGTRQITGFHQAHAAPAAGFSARLLADLGQFGVSYTIIALGSLATVWLLLRRVRRPWLFADAPVRSVITAWAASALCFLLYAGLFGTLEEQMFYPLVVTSTASLALTVDLALPVRSAGRERRARSRAALVMVAAVSLALVADAGVWGVVHTRHDDTYRRTLAWTRTHIPEGSTVDTTEGSAQFLMRGVRLGTWDTVGALDRNHADYLLMSTQLVAQGYSPLDPALIGQLDRRARLLHTESGPTTGQLRVYDVRPIVAATTAHSAKGGGR